MEEDDLLIFIQLCKAGYASSIEQASQMTARTVLQALAYDKFIANYELAFLQLNRKD